MAATVLIDAFAVHGGRIDRAAALLPAVDDWVDLSTGIAPWSYPAVFDPAMLTRLPDPAALAGLEDSAASAFGSDPARTVAVPGSDLALRLLGRIIGGRAAVVGPGYSGHVAMWPTPPERIGAGDVAVCTADTLILARPNNPDGMAIAADLLRRPGRTIVDEAFVDATPDIGLADRVGADRVGAGRVGAGRDWPGLIVLRSFGKFYGLAGVRLGFVIAPADIAADLRRLIGDWPVSGIAVATGTAAYRDTAWQAAQRDRLDTAAARLHSLLAVAGLRVTGGTAFFRLVETRDRDALFSHLLAAGILTRPFADCPRRLRLGLPGDETHWRRLAAALTDWNRQ